MRIRASGVTFAPGYPNNLLDIIGRIEGDETVAVELVRDRENAHDMNAVSIRLEGRHLGWVPAHTAKHLAPRMDRGEAFTAAVAYCPVDLEHRDRPGLEIEVEEVRA